MTNHPKTTIDKLRMHLAVAKRSKRSVFLLSIPGLGKTTEITAFAHEANAVLHVLVASLLDRIDLSGIPHVTEVEFGAKTRRVTKFAPMQLMAELSVELNPDGAAAVLYFNEVNSAPESVQATLLRIFNERAIGDLHLRDNVMLIADGNPLSSMSIGRDLPMAMRRRFYWIYLDCALQPWKRWALEHGVDARVISFFEVPAFAPLFCTFDPKCRENVTYACPASWTYLATALRAMEEEEKLGNNVFGEEDRLVLFAGEVGMEAGQAFAGYLKFADRIPDVDAVLRNPDNAKIPDDVQMRALLVGSLINRVRLNPEGVPATMKIAERLFDNKQGNTPEYGVFLARALACIPTLRGAVQRTSGFKKMTEMLMKEKELLSALSTTVGAKS